MDSVFNEKNIAKAILAVGLPSMLGQLTTLIYNIADTFFVSLTREPGMIAAVTLSAPVLLIIMSIAAVFGMGGSSVIARLLGEGRRRDVCSALNFCFYAMVLSGIVVAALGLAFKSQIAVLAGADADNLLFTSDYLKYIFLGTPFIMLSNGLIHLFRSIGLIRESTIGLVLGNLTNIVLDYVFIVIFSMGTAGAALATSLGFLLSSAYYIICLIRRGKSGNDLISLSLRGFSPDSQMVRNIISIGVPGAMITVLMSISNIVLNNYIGIYGSDAVASYGIAYKIDMIPIMLSVGLAQGVTPLIGYSYGAGEKERMKRIMLLSSVYGVVLGLLFTVVFIAFGHAFSSVFLSDPALVDQSASFLMVLSLSAAMPGIINMVSSYFQALGKALKSLVITLLRNTILFIPGVIVLNRFFGLSGVIATQPIVEAILALICIMMYTADIRGRK